MARARISRTYGPIHFEDLEPHRFEDLVRQLIYDYKDWLTIEATGRSGQDGGFDIRAFERVEIEASSENDGEVEVSPSTEGDLWMIQCKREKAMGPKRLKSVLDEIDAKNPPYGYILAASANFSKNSFDVFREELRKKGVMEFYLWGKAELEDMLHLPKNDRILFTFFGVSLVSRRRSRATEIRQVVNNKNKLYRILGDRIDYPRPVLLRDSQDTNYPYEDRYKDFAERPRWREYEIVEYHPLGVIMSVHEYFAYVDTEKKRYDYTEVVDLSNRQNDFDEDRGKQRETREAAKNYWEYLPRSNRAKFFVHGIVRYDEMLIIDDKGDGQHGLPHIFVEFNGSTGPFARTVQSLRIGLTEEELDRYERVKQFPSSFPPPKIGRIYQQEGISLDDHHFRLLRHGDERFFALYDCDGRYDYLNPGDAVLVQNTGGDDYSKYYLQITRVESLKVKDYLKRDDHLAWDIELQIGNQPQPSEILNVHEFKRVYEFEIERIQNRGQ